jgi:uncharacterized protein YkwD
MHGRRPAIALAALALCATAGTATSVARTAPPGRSAAEVGLLVEMNAARVANGLPRLRRSAILARPARAHSSALVAKGELDHDGPNGEPFWKRLVAAGFPRGRWMGENLALMPSCDYEPAEVVQMWLDSPGHRANLLSRKFRVVGVGVASDADCTTTVLTTDFGG